MEVRRREGDVAQRCGTEDVGVVRRVGDGEAPLVLFGQHVGAGLFDQAEGEVALPADIGAGMAGRASLVDEERQTLLLVLGQRRIVAVQKGVEGSRRDQGCFEGFDRLGEVVEGDRIFLTREGRLEPLDILRHRLQRRHDLHRGIGHFDAGLNRTLGLGLQVFGAAVPELGDVEHGIEGGRRVARTLLPAVADRGFEIVVAAGRQVVAGVAREHARRRDARVEEQCLAEQDLVGGDRVVGDRRGGRRQCLEDLERACPKIRRRRVGGKGRRGQDQDGDGCQ